MWPTDKHKNVRKRVEIFSHIVFQREIFLLEVFSINLIIHYLSKNHKLILMLSLPGAFKGSFKGSSESRK